MKRNYTYLIIIVIIFDGCDSSQFSNYNHNLILIVIQGIIFGSLSSVVAKWKNRDLLNWFLIGFVFGIFGFVTSLIFPKYKKSNVKYSFTDFNPENYIKKCPDCAEMIKLEARVCRYCGRKFLEEDILNNITEERNKYIANNINRVTVDKNIFATIDKSKLNEDRKTLRRLTVDRIDEKTGNILFTYEWRKGIKYSLIGQVDSKRNDKVIIYASGKFFYCNENELN